MEHHSVFAYVLFPDHLRRSYLIQEMDDSKVQGGLVDSLEAEGYQVEIVKSIRISTQGPFYKIGIELMNNSVRTIVGNLNFHAEALDISAYVETF